MKIYCFDLWGTLIRSTGTDGSSYEQVLVRQGIDSGRIFPVVRDRLMTQRLSVAEMATELCRYFGIADQSVWQAVELAWVEDNRAVEWLPGAREELIRLRRTAELVLVTNSTYSGWQSVEAQLGLSRLFDHLFLSWWEGIAKPDERVWQRIESWYPSANQADFWMIGDSEDDLEIPALRGWKVEQRGM